jgi:hypothetical protein
MTAPISRTVHRPTAAGRLRWLPAHGYGNGLDDDAWAPALEVDARIMALLLEAFRAAGVPAYVATERPSEAAGEAWPSYRIWVGTSAYGRAEDVLIEVMPALLRHLPGDEPSP